MSWRTVDHISHPQHQVILKEDVVGQDDVCYGCNRSVIGLPTYTCTDIDCQSFYLHKSCAELPPQINHILVHSQHPLSFLPRLVSGSRCDICKRRWERFSYGCECGFNVCVNCATTDEVKRVIHHIGHDKKQHYLTLFHREAWFVCDACGVMGKDSSYICNSCEFWIHESCALSPILIETPTYHHHRLHLIFSIPDIHRTFKRACGICDKFIYKNYWLYYCQKCTFFVHMTCATSSDTGSTRDEVLEDFVDDGIDLLQLPLPNEESLLDLLIKQFNKFQVEPQGESSIVSNTSTIPSLLDPPGFISHWSHENHPLELHQYSNISSWDDDNDDTLVLVCDACILPITAAHPSYYACAICQFFLHLFCATKLPFKLAAGESPFHPEHGLSIRQPRKFFNSVICEACDFSTNGFYYHCETCVFNIEIRCALLPNRIKHESHSHHLLVLRKSQNNSLCKVTKVLTYPMEYGCETCENFQIRSICTFYPNMLKHRYDPHPLTYKNPPFFYEGAIYCQICEEEVNNQVWLYHCDECDQSFHVFCLRRFNNIKTGGMIIFDVDNNSQPHTLTFVIKRKPRKNSPQYVCHHCRKGYNIGFFLECDGCGILICCLCADKLSGYDSNNYKSPQLDC